MSLTYDPAVLEKKLWSLIRESRVYEKEPRWNPATELPNLSGKVAIVTGANDPNGIGFIVAYNLALKRAKVYIGARSLEKAQTAIEEMHRQAGESAKIDVAPLVMDLSSLEQARDAAKTFKAAEMRLDILVNNAAVLAEPLALTKYGVSNSIVVNHLSPFLFTLELLPLIKKAAQDGSGARVVNVSSSGHRFPPTGLQLKSLDDLNQAMGGTDNVMGNMNRYGLSKLANVLFANELQKRFDAEGVPALAISLHPGGVSTTGALRVMKDNLEAMEGTITPPEGALTPLFAAAHPRVWERRAEYSGAFLMPYGVIGDVHDNAKRADLAESLWGLSEEIVKPYRS